MLNCDNSNKSVSQNCILFESLMFLVVANKAVENM